MMETYADLLKREKKKVEKKMTNYNYDEMAKQEVRADYDGALGQTDAVSPEWNARRSDEDMIEKRAQFAQNLIDT